MALAVVGVAVADTWMKDTGYEIDGVTLDYNIWQQLHNIGTTTISATQWGYLGGQDQAVKTTSAPTFAGLTSTANINSNEDIIFDSSGDNIIWNGNGGSSLGELGGTYFGFSLGIGEDFAVYTKNSTGTAIRKLTIEDGDSPKAYFDNIIGLGIGTTTLSGMITSKGTDNYPAGYFISSSTATTGDNNELAIAVRNEADPTGVYRIGGNKNGDFLITRDTGVGYGSVRLYINANTGDVGIGTTNPQRDLDVNGDFIADNYYSGDGTQGMTGTCNSSTTLTIKDGLVVSCS